MANNITLSYPSAFHHQFFDRNGKPLTDGKLYTYSAGTSTPIPTYKTIGDTSSTNTNTNPIILDNAGMAYIVIETDKAYKFVLFDKNDAKIAEWDNVTGNIGGGGGGGSEDIVVVGTPNEIDVSGSVTQGVKRYVVSLSNSVKSTILYLVGLYNNVLNSLGNKADKVQGATAGNLAALDANGNLTDSGSKVADFKTKQTPVQDPSASGNCLEFIDSVSQNANGEIVPHKKSVQDGSTAQKGVVKLSNAIDSTSVTEAATPKAVKDAYDELNNKIVARAVFLSQAEWAVQSQLPGDPAKVYYVENGTGEDAYTVYVWRESTSTYEEVDESSIDLDGYWHDSPTTTGNGNVVTNITLGNDGVPQVEKGLTALTQHQSVTDNDPTLAWGTRSKVGTIGGTDLHVTMPSNPASGKLDSTGDASNTTSTFTKASGDTSSMTRGSKLSVIFTAISSFFASLKALAFKDTASYNDLSSGVQSSLNKADTALQSHQSVTDNNPTLAWGTTSKVGKVGSTDLRVTMPANPAQNLPASVITSGTFNTDRIADDAITANKVKDNETLPVNVSGKSSKSDSLDTKYPSLTDFNALVPGRDDVVQYSINGNYTNGPSGVASIGYWGILQVFWRNRYPYQLFLNSTSMWVRYSTTQTGGSWTNWGTWTLVNAVADTTTLKSNTATLYIAGYTDNNIHYYHVKDIKNGCVNHVDFSGITNSTCDITFEAPSLSTGEEYDYIISLEGYTNNSGYSTGAYVENCKQILHYISDGNLWIGEPLFLQATDWRQICVVRGNTCEWKRVALS